MTRHRTRPDPEWPRSDDEWPRPEPGWPGPNFDWSQFREQFVARLGVASVVVLVTLAVAGTWLLAGA